MDAKNKVIAGDYEGKKVKAFNAQCAYIVSTFLKQFIITKDSILSYEILDQQHSEDASIQAGNGLIEGLLPGSRDLLAELSAKNKGVNIIALEFTDGKKSLMEVDDIVFQAILKTCGR